MTQGIGNRNLFMFRPRISKNDSAALSVMNLMNQSDEEMNASNKISSRMKIVNVVDHNGVEHKIFKDNPLLSPARSSARHLSLAANSVDLLPNSTIIGQLN
jgi:hypothetical protein